MTGHTGFKGSWLSHWLTLLGARVHGLALDPPTEPSLFVSARTGGILASDGRIDVRDASGVRDALLRSRASIVFHLAAQPLVRDGYRRPSETFATNVIGTTNLLEAIRSCDTVAGAVIVTTDKVYEPRKPNAEDARRAHRESDRLGANDPYSWSKVMAEQAVAAFASLPEIDGLERWKTPVATARAGNVIGGGDWSPERLLPDCVRAFQSGRAVTLRFPTAVRPWQHVLEPLNGYLVLAESLTSGDVRRTGTQLPTAFNFGPSSEGEETVRFVADSFSRLLSGSATVVEAVQASTPPESPVLRLESGLAQEWLGWAPRFDLEKAITLTAEWYVREAAGEDAASLILEQIADFES